MELVRVLCEKITRNLDHKGASTLLKQPFLSAAELGICEIVEEIIKAFPDAIWFSNEMNCNAFQLAITNRHKKIFDLVFQTSTADRNLLLMSIDTCGNNILHLVGKLAPQSQLNLIPGAAMQMQRELQWFKAVKNIVHPRFIDDKNYEGKTPAMVFSEEHKELVKEGEQWMKSAASSSSVAAALIATVVFASAIAIPGDYDDDGTPNFHKRREFTIFAVSDTIAMFLSFAAIIMFLSIFTSRYAEKDFLEALPRKLIQCLLLSFSSITWTAIAFACAAYLVFFGENAYGLVLVAVSFSVPTFLFTSSQYPLLIYLLVSTYRPGIFRKKSKHVVY
ncbi:hypothetical protein Pint_12053 [Pistacia integerrima]|uniref:Uncharacterized protein n=1 Tax=Pistacia integerrima TaxID=434235 RepID=A0ACC0XHP3_9ROSI|nr:hypothetical protein Pint_12053 [Pistacia integerrima]